MQKPIVDQAMTLTGEITKTALIHFILEEVIRKQNPKKLLKFGEKAKIKSTKRHSK